MQIIDVDRIMIATPDAAEAAERFESLLDVSFGDLVDAEVETGDEIQHTEVAYAYPGLEVIAPTEADNAVASYIDQNGSGLFGVVFRVADIETAREELVEQGVKPIADENPGRVRELHYHPGDFGGVYTILTEYPHPGFAQSV